MKEKINYGYLIGGLVLLVLGSIFFIFGSVHSESISQKIGVIFPFLGIVYLVYSFNFLSCNNFVNISFFFNLVYFTFSLGLRSPGDNGLALAMIDMITFPIFILGFLFLVIGLIRSLFQKPKEIV